MDGNYFNYPKSLYLLIDILKITTTRDSTVLDFFAGSGTTGHAVLELNKDGGNRKFILCTNNENKIVESVTWPRIKNCIYGYKDGKKTIKYGGNLKYFRTCFVPAESTDKNKEKLTIQSIEMLCLREDTFEQVCNTNIIKIFKNSKKYTGILLDEQKIPLFKKQIKNYNMPISIYIFSLGDDDFSEEFADMQENVKLCSIPAAILRVYKRIFR